MIALDAMGGDHAPDAMVAGAARAVRAGLRVLLVGDADRLRPLVPAGVDIPIHHCPTAVAMGERRPTQAVRASPAPSVAVTMRLVAEGRAAAGVSCGHTGATMAAALFSLGRLPGVERPAITMVVPRADGGELTILDLGANVDCRPAHLAQFAVMGSAFTRRVRAVERPRVGLLSNGEEPGKGDERVQKAGPLVAATGVHFVGNIEPTAAFGGGCDVLVCDGFVGNIMLKTVEATAAVVTHIVREEILAHRSARAGAWLLRPALRRIRERTDASSLGGALLLGVDGVVVVGHGRSDAQAVSSAVRYAARCVEEGLVDGVREAMAAG
ncbi:MAG: phosphate acyltransferase PlsX [Deltaproteobacteria bacterium]|nr:MAG: phosphate acyltransferase PlsX [Deltaproteobacteria bacterium]